MEFLRRLFGTSAKIADRCDAAGERCAAALEKMADAMETAADAVARHFGVPEPVLPIPVIEEPSSRRKKVS